MIAPLRGPPRRRAGISETLRRARQHVADSLLPLKSSGDPPSVAAWRAWLIVAWMALVAVAFLFGQFWKR